MNDNFFIDTNILIYSYSEDEGSKKNRAREIAKHPNAIISTQVLKEFANTLNKKFKINWENIESVLAETIMTFPIYVNNPQDIEEACKIADRYQYSFYDSLIIYSALESGCKILYTEDLQHGHLIDNKLKIINPFQ